MCFERHWIGSSGSNTDALDGLDAKDFDGQFEKTKSKPAKCQQQKCWRREWDSLRGI